MNQMITVVLRLIHIVAGVSWAGAVFLMVGFIYPSMRDVGPPGGGLMQQFQRRRLPVFMNTAAGLTMLSGFILYGRAVAMTDGAWARTTSGMVFGLGGLATILAAIIGGVFVSRSANTARQDWRNRAGCWWTPVTGADRRAGATSGTNGLGHAWSRGATGAGGHGDGDGEIPLTSNEERGMRKLTSGLQWLPHKRCVSSGGGSHGAVLLRR